MSALGGALEVWRPQGTVHAPRPPSCKPRRLMRHRTLRSGEIGGRAVRHWRLGRHSGPSDLTWRTSSVSPTGAWSASPPVSSATRTTLRMLLRMCSWHSAGSSVPAGEAMGWLSVAAAHTALNRVRSGRRRAAREAAADDRERVSRTRPTWSRLATIARRVRAALARLPRRQAVALVLRHSGLSYAEVAAALDLSPGSVGTTVRRAESALRKELIRHEPSE